MSTGYLLYSNTHVHTRAHTTHTHCWNNFYIHAIYILEMVIFEMCTVCNCELANI